MPDDLLPECTILLFPFDLNDIDEIDGIVWQIVEKNGMIDGLVHCAGLGLFRPIKLSKPEYVRQMTQTHYFAFVELLRAVSDRKRSNCGASLIGVSSVAASRGDKAQGVYAASKAAMNAVVHSFAKELADRNIRVNTIALGMVETDMYRVFLESGGNNEDLFQNQFLGLIPVEYAGNAICFLLSDASKYITGSTINYDAGSLS